MAKKKALPARDFKQAIEAKRPNLVRIQEQTNDALALYFGDKELWPLLPVLPKEEDEKWKIRRRAVADGCRNYLKEIAETFVEGVFFTQLPTRKASPVLDKWLSEDYHKFFIEQFAPFSLFMPELFIQVGGPQGPEPVNAQQQQEMRAFPTLAVHLPHKVQHFTEDAGRITSLVLQCGNGFEVWDEKYCIEVNKAGDVVKHEEHGFKRCPFVRAIYRENLALPGIPRVGHAYLSGVVGRAKAALEHWSQFWEGCYFHLHPKLVTDPETLSAMLETGTGAGIPVPEQKNNAGNTRYLVMPNTELEILRGLVYEEDPRAIYQEARVRDRSSEGTMASGIAKAMDLVPEVKALKQVAGFWQNIDRQILELAVNGGGGNVPVQVEYSSTFDTKSPAEVVTEVAEVSTAMSTGQLPASPTARLSLAVRLYDILLPDIDEKTRNTIKSELEAATEAAKTPAPAAPKPFGFAPKQGKPEGDEAPAKENPFPPKNPGTE